jgi:hypothetical protein
MYREGNPLTLPPLLRAQAGGVVSTQTSVAMPVNAGQRMSRSRKRASRLVPVKPL